MQFQLSWNQADQVSCLCPYMLGDKMHLHTPAPVPPFLRSPLECQRNAPRPNALSVLLICWTKAWCLLLVSIDSNHICLHYLKAAGSSPKVTPKDDSGIASSQVFFNCRFYLNTLRKVSQSLCINYQHRNFVARGYKIQIAFLVNIKLLIDKEETYTQPFLTDYT